MPRAAMTCSTNTPVPCGLPAVRDGRCAVHAAEHEARRGTAAQRGYGAAHQRQRTALLRRRLATWRRFVGGDLAAGADRILWCPRCGQAIPPPEPLPTTGAPDPLAVADDDLHADHFATRPPAEPDRLAHADCNVRAATRQRGPQT